jgi:Fic family protein
MAVYTFKIGPDWALTTLLSQVDRFDAAWAAIEKREGQSLRELKSIATVRSVGASTRIEGSKMTDEEVKILIAKLDVTKLDERDQQEVAGYYETLDLIAESFQNIELTENNIKSLHNTMLKHSEKDAWHKGGYKQHSNAVEATRADGTKYVIFRPTDPGFATEDAMRKLVRWYNSDHETPSLVKIAVFVYEFLSIHPFQDGNGRLSRLLTTQLLLQNNYRWIQYVSFEHEIENQKGDYYKVLMDCQRNRPGEDVYPWVTFILKCLIRMQGYLMNKIDSKTNLSGITARDRAIYQFIDLHPGTQAGHVSSSLGIPLPTVKKALQLLTSVKLVAKHGQGRATHYTLTTRNAIQKDMNFTLSASTPRKVFTLTVPGNFIEIKKVVLKPVGIPLDSNWGHRVINQNPGFMVHAVGQSGSTYEGPLRLIAGWISPQQTQPVFPLPVPEVVPDEFKEFKPLDYPLKVTVELQGDARGLALQFFYDGILNTLD